MYGYGMGHGVGSDIGASGAGSGARQESAGDSSESSNSSNASIAAKEKYQDQYQSVIDQQSGAIDFQNLATVFSALQQAVRDKNNHLPAGKTRDKLCALLQEAQEFAETTTTSSAKDGLHIADYFRKAADLAFSWQSEPGDTFGALFKKLKNHHISHSAPELMDRAATRQKEAQLGKRGVYFDKLIPGAAHIREKGVGLRVGLGSWLAGVGVSLGLRKQKLLLVDNDLDVDAITRTYSSGGLYAKLKGVFGFSTSAEVVKGHYSEAEKVEDIYKIERNRQNNADKGRWTKRSASKLARNLRAASANVSNFFRKLLGYSVLDKESPSFLSDEKIAKGAFNQTQMRLIAQEISPELGALIAQHYPSAIDLARSGGRKQLPRNPIQKAIPVSLPVAASRPNSAKPVDYAWMEKRLNAGASMGLMPDQALGMGMGFAGIGASANTQWVSRQNELELMNSSHGFLNPQNSKDIGRSIQLIHEVVNGLPQQKNNPFLFFLRNLKHDFALAGIGETVVARDGIKGRFDHLSQALMQMRGQYLDFCEHALQVLPADDKGLSTKLQARMRANRIASAKFINDLVWGGAYQADAIEKNPKEFIARSCDAMSFALGHLGVDLAWTKQYASKLGVHLDGLADAADKQFRFTQETFDRAFLPIKDEDRHRYGVIHSPTPASKQVLSANVSFSTGLGLDPLGLSGAGVNLPLIGGTAVQGSVTWSKVPEHPNQVRIGEYLDLNLNVTSGLLTGDLVQVVVKKALNKLLESKKFSAEERRSILQSFDKDFKLTPYLLSELTASKGSMVEITLRKSPNDERGGNSGWRLMYGRVSNTKSNNIGLSAPLAEGTGVDLGISVAASQFHQAPLLEIKGNDFGYHVLQISRLTGVLGQPEPGVIENAQQRNQRYAKNLSEHLRDSFERFEGNGILDTISDYVNFVQQTEKSGRSEFQRFAQPEFARYAAPLDDAERFAPGIAAHNKAGRCDLSGLEAHFKNNYSAPQLAEQIKQFQQAKTPAEKKALLLQVNPKTNESLLDAYIKIMTTHKAFLGAKLMNNHCEPNVFGLRPPVQQALTRSAAPAALRSQQQQVTQGLNHRLSNRAPSAHPVHALTRAAGHSPMRA